MTSILVLLFLTSMVYAKEDKLDGGVSAEKPVKIVDTFKAPGCIMKSKDRDVIYWKFIGTFLDGEMFDSGTYRDTLGKGDLIKGVDEGMRGLCVGDKRTMTIHSSYGYGVNGSDGIPANATIVYDVQLLSIERPGGAIETLESKLNRTGGVSQKNKIKIVDTFPTGLCKVRADENDRVTWNSDGYLLDGTLFDRGEYSAILGQEIVIKGSDVGVRGLCVGDKRSMTIHPDWAYGAEGVKGKIPPNATLIFDIVVTNIGRTVTTGSSKKEKIDITTGLKPEQKLRIEHIHDVKNCTMRTRKDDKILWKYVATYLDDKEFLSGTYKATLGSGDIIMGCDQGMRNMCVGEKRKLVIHSSWGYGEKGLDGKIPPKATLVFTVEMLEIDRPAPKMEL